MLYGYDADLFSSQSGVNTMGIRDIGSELLGTLTNHRRALNVRPHYNCEFVMLSAPGQEINRPLMFVGHSLGGLVVKQVSRNL